MLDTLLTPRAKLEPETETAEYPQLFQCAQCLMVFSDPAGLTEVCTHLHS
jgi:hypothetical protein